MVTRQCETDEEPTADDPTWVYPKSHSITMPSNGGGRSSRAGRSGVVCMKEKTIGKKRN